MDRHIPALLFGLAALLLLTFVGCATTGSRLFPGHSKPELSRAAGGTELASLRREAESSAVFAGLSKGVNWLVIAASAIIILGAAAMIFLDTQLGFKLFAVGGVILVSLVLVQLYHFYFFLLAIAAMLVFAGRYSGYRLGLALAGRKLGITSSLAVP